MRSLLWLTLTIAGCAGSRVPPVRPAEDPSVHELHLVAFAADQYLVVERVVGPQPMLELVAVSPTKRERKRFADLTGELDPWPGAAGVVDAIWDGDLGATLEKLGFSRPARCHEGIETPYGQLLLEGRQILLSNGEYQTVVAELAEREPVEQTWYASGGGARWAALSVKYEGAPSTRDLRVIALEPAAGQLAALRAFDHHQRGEYEIARGFWEDAIGLDPTSARSHYNLACAYARLGQPESAISLLLHAIRLGGDRIRSLARHDPDLTILRQSGRLEEILRRERPKRGKCPWQVPVITCD